MVRLAPFGRHITRAKAAQLHARAGSLLNVFEIRPLGPQQLAAYLVPRRRVHPHLEPANVHRRGVRGRWPARRDRHRWRDLELARHKGLRRRRRRERRHQRVAIGQRRRLHGTHDLVDDRCRCIQVLLRASLEVKVQRHLVCRRVAWRPVAAFNGDAGARLLCDILLRLLLSQLALLRRIVDVDIQRKLRRLHGSIHRKRARESSQCAPYRVLRCLRDRPVDDGRVCGRHAGAYAAPDDAERWRECYERWADGGSACWCSWRRWHSWCTRCILPAPPTLGCGCRVVAADVNVWRGCRGVIAYGLNEVYRVVVVGLRHGSGSVRTRSPHPRVAHSPL